MLLRGWPFGRVVSALGLLCFGNFIPGALSWAAAPDQFSREISSQASSSQAHPLDFSVEDGIDFYSDRYPLSDPYKKLVSDRGNGFEPLYGVRNFRVVLQGVQYRGGANNLYHRDHPRKNNNPLPEDGLENLCKEGFGLAYYLYTTNYNTASHEITCDSPRGKNTLRYLQVSPFSDKGIRTILKAIHETIQDYRHGPIYAHCWNGWHASGLISATSLMQFCGISAEEAVDYWNRNTDGDNGSSYDHIRKRIRAFKPDPALQISPEIQARICPKLD